MNEPKIHDAKLSNIRIKNEYDYNIIFEYEYVDDMQILIQQIKNCEGRHSQQAIYSTFHGALTQVCFGCLKVRSTIRR